MLEKFTYKSSNGVSDICASIWSCEGAPRAIVQCSHGMIEDANSFAELAKLLNSHNILVCSYDLLGHGRSEIDNNVFMSISNKDAFKCSVLDMKVLHDIVSTKYPGIPYFMLAFSLSTFSFRIFIEQYSNLIDGALILGTGDEIQSYITSTKIIENLYESITNKNYDYFAHHIDEKQIVDTYLKKNPANLSWFRLGDEQATKYLNSYLWKYILTIDTYYNFTEEFKLIDDPSCIEKISKKLPIMFLSGKNDILGNYGRAVTEIFKNYKSYGFIDIGLKLYEGLFHSILQSNQKNKVMQDILLWLNSHM